MGRPAAFSFEGVEVSYDGSVAALSDVTLEIAAGEMLAIVGPSGAGKTTLLRLCNGSVRPTRGIVRVNGERLDRLGPADLRRTRASIGFIHQDLRLVPNLRVVQNVVAGRLGRMSLAGSLRAMLLLPRDLQREAYDLLDRVGIAAKLHERTDRLSGGERQRVAIARALAQDPAALLADEPVSSVDPARARDTVQLLTTISRERGLTLCVSLHNVDLARAYFPRLVGVRRGRVIIDARTAELSDRQFESLYRLAGEDHE
ncbi:MAG TPA: ATP-binding cassette domain-containing protein [Vicinamibacterales bacterium]|nr:ATP-binding cassette domain-containing protein [Vicinamibacterales bacterium]